MSKVCPEMENLARMFQRDHRQWLDHLAKRNPASGFEQAVHRLFGNNPGREKTVRIGNREFKYSGFSNSRVNFLPAQWQEELDKTKGTWPGCDNWWAGYPFIVWIEIRASDDGTTGYLKLNAEVGPISNHKIRTGIVEAIQLAASVKHLKRIQFPEGASDKRHLYSRFLRNNFIAVNDILNTDEVQGKLAQLIADFDPEFELVASVIPLFLPLAKT